MGDEGVSGNRGERRRPRGRASRGLEGRKLMDGLVGWWMGGGGGLLVGRRCLILTGKRCVETPNPYEAQKAGPVWQGKQISNESEYDDRIVQL